MGQNLKDRFGAQWLLLQTPSRFDVDQPAVQIGTMSKRRSGSKADLRLVTWHVC